MVDKVLRVPKEEVLRPIARSAFAAIHPTTLTLIAFGVGLAAAVALWQGAHVLGLGLWLLNRLLDGLDGTVARTYNKQSDLGGYIDILCDHAIYAALPVALALGVAIPSGYLAVTLLMSSFYINGASWMFLAALLEKHNRGAAIHGDLTTITMPGGLIEGTETILFYCLFILFPAALVPLFLAMAILVLITAAQRLVWAARNLR